MDETRQEILKDLEFPLGTIQILRNHWTGWVGSKNGHFCLLSVNRGWVGLKKSNLGKSLGTLRL